MLGQMAAQQSAWAMFRDEPMFGIGTHMFPSELPRYAGKVATAILHPPDASDNRNADLAAQSEVVGLVGWAVFVGGFIALIVQHLARFHSRSGDPSDRCSLRYSPHSLR